MKLFGKEWNLPKRPEVRLPSVRLPGSGALKQAGQRLSHAKLPKIKLPAGKLADLRLPKIELPKADLSALEHGVKSAGAKAAGAVTSLAAAAAVLFSLTAPTLLPEDRTADMPADRPAVVVMTQREEEGQTEPAVTDEDRRRTRAPARKTLLSALLAVGKAVLPLLGTLAARTLTLLFSSAFARITGKPVSSLLGFLGDVLVTFVTMLLLFGWLYKSLYPERSLRSFYTWKNLAVMLAASVLISLARVLCGLLPEKAYAVSVILDALATVLVFAAAWRFLFTRKGLIGRPLRAVLRSKAGVLAGILLVGGTLLSAAFRLLVLSHGKAAAYGACVAAVLACGLAACLGGRLIRLARRQETRKLV